MADDDKVKVDRFGFEQQRLFIEVLIADQNLMDRCRDIIRADYFDAKLREPMRSVIEHVEKYGEVPSLEILNSLIRGVSFEARDAEFVAAHTSWFLDEFEAFCKHKGMGSTLLDSVEELERVAGDGEDPTGMIEQRVREAAGIGLPKNLGYEHFVESRSRLERIREVGDRTSTGWKDIDRTLHGGVHKGELNIFAGASGSGKSLFLQNLALNWVFMGLNVVYVTLELTEDLCSLRFDSMTTEWPMSDIIKNLDDVVGAISKVKRSADPPLGRLRVVKMPSGTSSNAVRAFMKECEIRDGMEIHAVVVDYMGLMEPARRMTSQRDNAFNNDKYVSEELRDLAVEADVLFATASQLNRESINADDVNQSHIAGGISKINTADNVIYIVEKRVADGEEFGTYTVKFVKTRSSSGEGRFVKLKYGAVSLRISDDPEGGRMTQEEYGASVYDERVERTEKSREGIGRRNSARAEPSGDGSGMDERERKKHERLARMTGS